MCWICHDNKLLVMKITCKRSRKQFQQDRNMTPKIEFRRSPDVHAKGVYGAQGGKALGNEKSHYDGMGVVGRLDKSMFYDDKLKVSLRLAFSKDCICMMCVQFRSVSRVAVQHSSFLAYQCPRKQSVLSILTEKSSVCVVFLTSTYWPHSWNGNEWIESIPSALSLVWVKRPSGCRDEPFGTSTHSLLWRGNTSSSWLARKTHEAGDPIGLTHHSSSLVGNIRQSEIRNLLHLRIGISILFFRKMMSVLAALEESLIDIPLSVIDPKDESIILCIRFHIRKQWSGE